MAKELQSKKLALALVNDVRTTIDRGRRQVYMMVSSAVLETYWRIGRRIVEEDLWGGFQPQ